MAKLSDMADIFSGVNPEPSLDGDCHFLQIRHLMSDGADRITARRPTAGRAVTVMDGDVLLAARGEHAPAIRARPSQIGAYIALDIYLIRPKAKRLDPDYLAAFLMRPSTGALLRKSTAGASLPRIPKGALTSLDIPLPPIDRQRAIGGVASCIRRHRELTDRLVVAETMLAETSVERVFAELN
jgi:hypothetical protein